MYALLTATLSELAVSLTSQTKCLHLMTQCRHEG